MLPAFPTHPTAVFDRLREAGRMQQIAALADPRSGSGSELAGCPRLDTVGPVPLPLTVGDREIVASWYVAVPSRPPHGRAEPNEHISVIAFESQVRRTELPLVRIHSTCFTGDVLGSLRCDCGPQLQSALRQVSESTAGGMIVYMAAHEGRGIGLWSKAAAYLLQDEGLDTYEANRALGFQDDERDFRHAASLIHHLLGGGGFRLLTNNPDKVAQMRDLGLRDVVQQEHVVGVGARNCRYINAKREHGHSIPASALGSFLVR